jgi:hypothetical protein
MRWLLSALFVALWTFADVQLNEAALRQALAEEILRRAQSIGAPVLLDRSVDASWRSFLVSAPFTAFFLQLAVYGAWSLAYRLGGCNRRGFAAALAVVAAVTAVLWLYGLRLVFFMGYIPIEQPLMCFTVNAGLAFIKYSECARPPAPAPG